MNNKEYFETLILLLLYINKNQLKFGIESGVNDFLFVEVNAVDYFPKQFNQNSEQLTIETELLPITFNDEHLFELRRLTKNIPTKKQIIIK